MNQIIKQIEENSKNSFKIEDNKKQINDFEVLEYKQKGIKVIKNIYVFGFLILLVIIISSYTIYASVSKENNIEQERQNEDSQNQIIEKAQITEKEKKVLVIELSEPEPEQILEPEPEPEQNNTENVVQSKYSKEGKTYDVIANLDFPRLGINYPVLSSTSDALLKVSINKYWGANPNEVGNCCIVGHNYNDNKFFSKLLNAQNGDIIYITDLSGRKLTYTVYNTFVVDPYDTSCTSQLTNGNTEITLITCYNHGKQRFIVKAKVM